MSGNFRSYSASSISASSLPRRHKRKMNHRLTTFYELPRLDEMVLLQEIATPSDVGHSRVERIRSTSVNEQLERYNRWLPFVKLSNPGAKVRSTAMELQQTVHEINSMVAEMMIKFDRKIIELYICMSSFLCLPSQLLLTLFTF